MDQAQVQETQADGRRGEPSQSRARLTVECLRGLIALRPAGRVRNVNELFQEELTPADRVAIGTARRIGSWGFILAQTLVLGAWAVLNVVAWMRHWDPYPFVLMGLFLSLQAAYTAPLIMMAQNREAEKDRLMLHEDYETNRRAAEEIQRVVNVLEQHGHLLEILLEERRPEAALMDDEEGKDDRHGNGRERPRSP